MRRMRCGGKSGSDGGRATAVRWDGLFTRRGMPFPFLSFTSPVQGTAVSRRHDRKHYPLPVGPLPPPRRRCRDHRRRGPSGRVIWRLTRAHSGAVMRQCGARGRGEAPSGERAARAAKPLPLSQR